MIETLKSGVTSFVPSFQRFWVLQWIYEDRDKDQWDGSIFHNHSDALRVQARLVGSGYATRLIQINAV